MGRPSTPPGGTGAINPRQVRDRLWIARVRWRDEAGEYHRTVAEAPSKKQCADLVVTPIEEERRALRDRLTTGLTLGEVAERWLTSLERTRRRPSTIASYRATWRGTLAPVLHSRPVDALTRAEIQQVLLDGLFARHPGTWAPDGSWTPGHYRLDDQGRRIPLQGEQPRAVMKMLLRFAADRGYPPTAPTPLTARRHQNAEHPSFER